jgi:hypothetical protein
VKLIKGDEYNDKVWLGLSHSDSNANYIYQEFVTQQIRRLAGAKS